MLAKSHFIDFLNSAGITVNGTQPYDIRINNDKFFKNLLISPSLAAGEGYMAGSWDCDRLDELFFKLCRAHQHERFHPAIGYLSRLANSLFNFQSRLRSKQVAEKHYNLGNDLYEYMLGSSMAYTCGYWRSATSLDQAQNDKFELVCRKLELKSTDKVLELGCGWGSFAKYAAEKYGCQIVAANISVEQVRYAKESCRHLPVNVQLCDYRDEHIYNPNKVIFDKVVSIGLCEHVGPKNYRHLMEIAKRNMKPEGLFLLHTIGKDESSHYVDPWINKYIFPNGMLPSLAQLNKAMEDLLIVEDLHNFGADYDKTLMAWHHNFNLHWPLLKERYGEIFFRMWNYYLLSCAGAFRARGMQLWQLVLSPKGIVGGYRSVRDIKAQQQPQLELVEAR